MAISRHIYALASNPGPLILFKPRYFSFPYFFFISFRHLKKNTGRFLLLFGKIPIQFYFRPKIRENFEKNTEQKPRYFSKRISGIRGLGLGSNLRPFGHSDQMVLFDQKTGVLTKQWDIWPKNGTFDQKRGLFTKNDCWPLTVDQN